MRVARRGRDSNWHIVVEADGVCRISPIDWTADNAGHWPRVDLIAHSLGEEISCPACATVWTLEEMDCVFGTSRAAGNDLLVLVRCANCRLPHRVLVAGLMTAYPRVVDLMRGWADDTKRKMRFDQAEALYYGVQPTGDAG